MKVLIVSYSCAPLNVISSQRVNSLAAYLVRRGHSVEILTAAKHPIDGPIDAIAQRAILSSLATLHEVEFLGRRRWQGDEAVNSHVAQSGGAITHGLPRRALKKLRASLSTIFGALFDYRTIWAIKAVRHYKRNLAQNGYDVLITSSGPACVNYVGFRLKQMSPRIRWIADFRDLWSLSHSSSVTAVTRKIEEKLEKKLLRKAKIITTVSSHLAEQMASLHGTPVEVIRNGYEPPEFENVAPDREFFRSHQCQNALNIVYAGSIYQGRRDPLPLIRAIAGSELRNRIFVHFIGFNLEGLASVIRQENASDFCRVHPSKPREVILAIQKAADINLLLESGREDARGVLTGKLFELVALGRPILSLGPPLHFESMEILSRTGLHLHWESLKGDLAEISRRSKALVAKEEFVKTLSREAQFRRVVEIMVS